MKVMIAAIENGDEGILSDCLFFDQKSCFPISREDALDRVQSVFLKLWLYRHSLNEDQKIVQHTRTGYHHSAFTTHHARLTIHDSPKITQ
jgi:hypothetical protein